MIWDQNLVDSYRVSVDSEVSKVIVPDYSSLKPAESTLLDIDCTFHQLVHCLKFSADLVFEKKRYKVGTEIPCWSNNADLVAANNLAKLNYLRW